MASPPNDRVPRLTAPGKAGASLKCFSQSPGLGYLLISQPLSILTSDILTDRSLTLPMKTGSIFIVLISTALGIGQRRSFTEAVWKLPLECGLPE